MSDIVPFNFHGAQVRTIMDDSGNPWFVATDVTTQLGFANAAQAIMSHVDDEDRDIRPLDVGTGSRDVGVINESGLYSLAFNSGLPRAREFKRWITSEVLPAIRRTGQYSMIRTEPQDDLDIIEGMVGTLRAHRRRMAEIDQRVDVVEAKIAGAAGEHDWFSTLAYAKAFSSPTDSASCNAHGRRASRLMRSRGLEPKRVQHPIYGLVGSYPVEILHETR